MAERREIRVPDIGDFEQVEVVEILAKAGDRIAVDDPLVSIESEKATMEIPSPAAGVLLELSVKEGDRVSQGSLLAVLEIADAATAEPEAAARGSAPAPPKTAVPIAAAKTAAPPKPAPSPKSAAAPERPDVVAKTPEIAAPATVSASAPSASFESIELDRPARQISTAAANPVPDQTGLPHASPLVRRFARELGVPLAETAASGPHGRVLVDDVKRSVRERFEGETGGASAPARGAGGAGTATPASGSAGAGSSGIAPVPFVDPTRFGPIHDQPLTRIQKVSGPALHRSWLNVPHVTQHDEADITELERFRRDRKDHAAEKGVKLSPLLFVMKAVVIALREFPTLRSTLAPERDRLLVKDYYHLGIAVDTDQGLVVPVVRDVDRKGVIELAAELQAIAERARSRKLTPDDLAGACFTISSLGGIGGTAFSPIVNAPEVAILGLSKTQVKPVWRGPSPIDLPAAGSEGRFEPRLCLPLSLSYDHRVVDGALAVRFTTRLSAILADPMQLLL
ncbi:MAG: 2-oxo acid dehydrogenase subunit E2 [Deltaproteobacteria bacterium]|nr:2-oxo acid dehydrogenase subunit E2 [Deltaproteobacteria bacterium]